MRSQADRTARFVPPKVAGELMSVSGAWVYEQCRAGKIPHIRVGRDYRVDMVEWQKMIDEQSRNSLRQNGGDNGK